MSNSAREETMATAEQAQVRGATVEDEVVNHPLTALAIAAGIGFLIGALNRR